MSPEIRTIRGLGQASFVLCFLAGCASWDAFQGEDQDPDEALSTALASREEAVERAENTVAADVHLRRLAVRFPTHVPTLYANAVVAAEGRDARKAQNYLEALFRVEPVHPEAAVLRAQMALEAGNLPYARRLLQQQVDYVPDHALLHETLAGVLFLDGEYERALDTLVVALGLGSPRWRIEYHRGLISERLGRTDDAMLHYRNALSEQDDLAIARARLRALVERR